jgi:anti-sigma B factor antagonist
MDENDQLASDRPEDRLQITVVDGDHDDRTLRLGLNGDLDPFTAPLLRERLDDMEGVSELRLDVSDLRFIDSSGLRVLVIAHQKLAPNGGRLVLEGANDMTRRVIQISGLDDSFVLQ